MLIRRLLALATAGSLALPAAALLVLPGLTSIQVARSFRETIYLAPAFGLTSVVLGLFASLFLDVPPGATIVLSGLGVLLIVVSLKWLHQRLRERRPARPGEDQRSPGS